MRSFSKWLFLCFQKWPVVPSLTPWKIEYTGSHWFYFNFRELKYCATIFNPIGISRFLDKKIKGPKFFWSSCAFHNLCFLECKLFDSFRFFLGLVWPSQICIIFFLHKLVTDFGPQGLYQWPYFKKYFWGQFDPFPYQ